MCSSFYIWQSPAQKCILTFKMDLSLQNIIKVHAKSMALNILVDLQHVKQTLVKSERMKAKGRFLRLFWEL